MAGPRTADARDLAHRLAAGSRSLRGGSHRAASPVDAHLLTEAWVGVVAQGMRQATLDVPDAPPHPSAALINGLHNGPSGEEAPGRLAHRTAYELDRDR